MELCYQSKYGKLKSSCDIEIICGNNQYTDEK